MVTTQLVQSDEIGRPLAHRRGWKRFFTVVELRYDTLAATATNNRDGAVGRGMMTTDKDQ